ncbi:MAG: dihydrofolate reductase family protein [Acidimicrobiia bacterium]|nr:dihydrofolate reductase family protein [Acidimicrobiia bacterium]
MGIAVQLSLSLDGFFEAPDGDISWGLIDDEVHSDVNHYLRPIGAYLQGRKTYEVMVDYWPTADEDPSAPEPVRDYARIFREKPTFVFSRTLGDDAPWSEAVLREVDPAQIADLKERYGELVVGGPDLTATFMRLDLIDEYRLYIHPVVIGAGKRLFPPDYKADLRLTETRRFGNGVVLVRYDVKR